MEKAKADGATNWEFDLHHDVPHVFSVFPAWVLPYAAVGIDRIAKFAATQFSSRVSVPSIAADESRSTKEVVMMTSQLEGEKLEAAAA